MKLKNKKTGEIIEAIIVDHGVEWEIRNVYTDEGIQTCNSLAELNAEWEDVPTEEVWYLGERIGNYSMSKKEARKATEKILAWKRLKDFGCGFTLDDHFTVKFVGPDARKITSAEEQKSLRDSYKLLFGGEE